MNALKDIIRVEDLNVVFFRETIEVAKLAKQIERINIYERGFDRGVYVYRIWLDGGLALLWKNNIHVTLRRYSENHINIVVEGVDNKPRWRTGFYGEPNTKKRNVMLKCCGGWELNFRCLCAARVILTGNSATIKRRVVLLGHGHR